MTQLDRPGQSDPLSVPFTPGMRDNPDELARHPRRDRPRAPRCLQDPTPTEEFTEEWRNASYNCFSSGHKFCREVCPVMQVTRNESWTPTAFHANVVAMDKGELTIEEVAADYVNCTQCGACELRCPNTLFTGDFYRFRTRTVDVVKAVRAFAVESGVHQPEWQSWNARTDERTHEPVLGETPVSQEHVRDWSEGLDIPIGGETVLFVDCEAAFYRTSVPRAVAQILQQAGYRVRADGRAVVLRRSRRRDGVRRPGEAVRPAQPRQLALHRAPSGCSCSTRTTTSRSPRTTRSTSAPTSTSRSCSSSSCSPS